MSVSPLSNDQEGRGIVADKEARACLRRIALGTLADLNSSRVKAYRQTVEASKSLQKKQTARIGVIDSEVGCIVSLLERLPDSGESKEFRRMMEERRTALLRERGEVVQSLEKYPVLIGGSERLLREVEGHLANATFLMGVIEEADNAEGGVSGVADQPRGPGDNGAAPDAVRDV
jgi:hypothetical protein